MVLGCEVVQEMQVVREEGFVEGKATEGRRTLVVVVVEA